MVGSVIGVRVVFISTMPCCVYQYNAVLCLSVHVLACCNNHT